MYSEKTDGQFSTLLSKLQQQQILVDQNKGSWNDYFKNFQEGEKWQIDFVQNTNLQKASLSDVKKGYENARKAALAHNAALKQQTLGAKAATLGMKALSVASNMLLMLGISAAISAVIGKLSELANKEKLVAERAETMTSTLDNFRTSTSEGSKKIGELSEKYEELSKGVSETGTNISLTNDEYEEYKDVISGLSEIMPNLTTYFNEQGEKIGFVGGKLEDTTKKYKEYIKTQAQNYLRNGDEENTVQDILDAYHYSADEKNNDNGSYGSWRGAAGEALEFVSLYGIVSDLWDGEVDFATSIFGTDGLYSIDDQIKTLQKLVNISKTEWQTKLNDQASLNNIKNISDLSKVEIDYSGGSKSKNNTSKTQTDSSKIFDWIETKISRIERRITNLGNTAADTFKSWTTRENALDKQISEEKKLITTSDKAAKRYKKIAAI